MQTWIETTISKEGLVSQMNIGTVHRENINIYNKNKNIGKCQKTKEVW